MKEYFKGNDSNKYNNSTIMKRNIKNVMYNLHKQNDVNVLHQQHSYLHIKHFPKNPRYCDIDTCENSFKQPPFINANNNSNTISTNTNPLHNRNNNVNYNTITNSLQSTTRTSQHNVSIQSCTNKKQYRKLYFNSSMSRFNNTNTFNQRSINIINHSKPAKSGGNGDNSSNTTSSKFIYFKQQAKQECLPEQNSLFELAQSMLLIRKNSNDHLIQSYEETKKINNHKTLNRIPINQRLRVLKEIKNNIKDTLNSSVEDTNNALKRSASAQPNEKGFEKEMNKMVKAIFYPSKIKHRHIIHQQHFNTSNTNNNSMSSVVRNNSNNGFYVNCKREIESPKLIKQTKRPKINVPIYKDM